MMDVNEDGMSLCGTPEHPEDRSTVLYLVIDFNLLESYSHQRHRNARDSIIRTEIILLWIELQLGSRPVICQAVCCGLQENTGRFGIRVHTIASQTLILCEPPSLVVWSGHIGHGDGTAAR